MRFASGGRTVIWGEIAYFQDDPGIPIACKTPTRIQALVILWWLYVFLKEARLDSWRYCRVIAVASTDAFEDESVVLPVREPIPGIIEATSGNYTTAQLTGWKPVAAAEWKLRSPRTFPDGVFELNGDAIAAPPALANDPFGHIHVPNVPFARLYGCFDPKYIDPYVKEPAVTAARTRLRSDGPHRALSSSPKNPPERRLSGRYCAKIAAKKAELLAAASKASPSAMQKPRTKAPPTCFVHIYRLRVWFLLRKLKSSLRIAAPFFRYLFGGILTPPDLAEHQKASLQSGGTDVDVSSEDLMADVDGTPTGLLSPKEVSEQR